jgi:hypothetical protein
MCGEYIPVTAMRCPYCRSDWPTDAPSAEKAQVVMGFLILGVIIGTVLAWIFSAHFEIEHFDADKYGGWWVGGGLIGLVCGMIYVEIKSG